MTLRISSVTCLLAILAATSVFAGLPPVFEKNEGQFDRRVDYVVRTESYTGFLTRGRLHLALDPAAEGAVASVLVLEPAGGAAVEARGEGLLESRSHYLAGPDPESWVRGAPHVSRVRYRGVYPGIDLVYRSAGGAVHYDFEVAAGADPGLIRLDFRGAESLEIDAAGRLVVETASGPLVQAPPVAFQSEESGAVRPVAASFAVDGAQVSFALGPWDRSQTLVIDPPLEFSTFLGGTAEDVGNDVAVDAAGSSYVVGWTRSDDFPTTPGVYQETKSGDAVRINLFLSKISPAGDALVYSTYLGASSDVRGRSVAVDGFGQAHVLAQAWPQSDLFTTSNAVQSSVGNFTHAYVAKLDADGANILYATFLSGPSGSAAGGLAVDSIGDIYVAGSAAALGFPLLNGFQTTMAGISDAFFVKLDPVASSSLLYATFLGGAANDGAEAVDVDAAGRAYLTGVTRSLDFPVLHAVQPAAGGSFDAFATAIDPGIAGAGSLVYSTYIGGTFDENGTVEDGGVAVDDLGWATYGGTTVSSDLPTTPGAIQPAIAGSSDAFVYRLDPDGGLVFGTYFGGSGLEQLKDVAIDSIGRVGLFGLTLSSDLPVAEAFQPTRTNSTDLFLTILDPSASTLVQSSYLGGDSGAAEHAGGVAFRSNALVAAGNAAAGSSSNPFPTTPQALQPVNAGGNDAFLLRWPFVVPNQPPFAADDAYSVAEDGTLDVAAPGVLGNDTDPDGNALSAILETTTANGILSLAADGSFVFTPAPDFNGVDGFTYVADDQQAVSAPAQVTIAVLPVNDPPQALDDEAQTDAGVEVVIDLLANDSDVDGDSLTVAGVTQPAGGTVTPLGGGEAAYLPQPGFTGVDTFSYTAADGNGGAASALVTVTVVPVVLAVPVDFVPGKCPNGIKLQGGGRVKVAIAGTSDFDPATIDVSTVNVLGVPPLQASLRDVATPFQPFLGKTLPTDCNGLGGDGIDDLELRFDKRSLLQAAEGAFGPLTDGQVLVLPVAGELLPAAGGAALVGEDVVVLQ